MKTVFHRRSQSALKRAVIQGFILLLFICSSAAAFAGTFRYDGKSYEETTSSDVFIKKYLAGEPAAATFTTTTFQQVMQSLISTCREKQLEPSNVFQPSRWHCTSCSYILPALFPMKILAPHMQGMGYGATVNEVNTFARTGMCPKCSSSTFCVLTETNPNVLKSETAQGADEVGITARDLQNMKDYYRLLAMGWWKNRQGSKVCDKCNGSVEHGEGYIYGDWDGKHITAHRLLCDKCIDSYVGPDLLPKLQKNPNHCGYGKIEKARLYAELFNPTPKDMRKNGVPVSFRTLCRERYQRLLGDRQNVDLLSGDKIRPGNGYMITGGDYKNSLRVIDMYVAHYTKGGRMTREQALAKIEGMRINNMFHYKNLAISGENIHLFEPR
ncbi:hypothetical protein [Desulfobacula toluolica]|uniref:Uncharacterized protein n=1 Tax=Desulfobacula toluolica (strain DSM 7467 / Tol2) TaxID=651182 RepID=K0NKT3_DESTT|nr:hypothetical protein [Desulfobacula toluolica]CCK82176.1 uncharacterized protein TOL2_C40210 [Desulfobacula toluolica Tol2]